MRPLAEYIYLDERGIEIFFNQIVDMVETSRVTRKEKGVAAKTAGQARLSGIIKALGGLDGEVSAEVKGSRLDVEESKSVHSVEQKLRRLMQSLEESNLLVTSLDKAIRDTRNSREIAYINIREKFNAPQFYGGGSGVDRVNADRVLKLEKGGALDYHDADDYYRHPTERVILNPGIGKMRGGGVMGHTSHEAILFRGHSGRNVPLSIFGTLSYTPEYFHIKPFAIWK